MKKIIYIIAFFVMPSIAFSLPAFPGAEGFGSSTVGGRGGTVYIVDQLGDNAAAEAAGTTFREACEASGSRYIVFAVSGLIHLEEKLIITNNFVTIAGETSPGGICLIDYTVEIWANDVIIRHMRFRPGVETIDYAVDGNGDVIYYTSYQEPQVDAAACLAGNSISDIDNGYPCALTSGVDPEQLRGLTILGGSTPAWYPGATGYNIVLDHCSISWGSDETLLMDSAARDVTISNCIIAEGLDKVGHPDGAHSNGAVFSGKFDGVYNISFHHNYIANNRYRNPYVSGPFDGGGDSPGDRWIDLRNNVIYNFHTTETMVIQQNGAGNWIHNYVRRGPESGSYSFELRFEPPTPDANNLLYTLGNIGTYRLTQSAAQWCVGDSWHDYLVTTDYQKSTPYDNTGGEVTTTDMSLSYANTILANVGATKPFRDSVDTRLQSEWVGGTGAIRVTVDYPSDFPTFTTPTPPVDSNTNGIADNWEIATFGGLVSATDDFFGDGYNNVEYYFHYLAGLEPTVSTTTSIGSTGTGTGVSSTGTITLIQ